MFGFGFLVYLFGERERKKEKTSRRGGQRKGDRGSDTNSVLTAESPMKVRLTNVIVT